jgi:hypothetical protein
VENERTVTQKATFSGVLTVSICICSNSIFIRKNTVPDIIFPNKEEACDLYNVQV